MGVAVKGWQGATKWYTKHTISSYITSIALVQLPAGKTNEKMGNTHLRMNV